MKRTCENYVKKSKNKKKINDYSNKKYIFSNKNIKNYI